MNGEKARPLSSIRAELEKIIQWQKEETECDQTCREHFHELNWLKKQRGRLESLLKQAETDALKKAEARCKNQS